MITDINQLDLDKSYTYSDYLTWQFDEAVEIIKGKIFKMSPAPRRQHQRISIKLGVKIGMFLEHKSCELYTAPFDVRFVKNKDDKIVTTVTQPDICVICDESKLDDAGCLGAPDFIIEILSPSTKKKDLNEKFNLYEEFGVNEYWIADPDNETLSIFVLENNKYAFKGAYSSKDKVEVHTLEGLTIDLKEIFE